MDGISRLSTGLPPGASFGRGGRPAVKANAPAPGTPDSVDISSDARAAAEGAPPPPPATYGRPRAAGAGGASGVEADTTRSRRLTELMAEIEAVQQSTASLIDRYRMAG